VLSRPAQPSRGSLVARPNLLETQFPNSRRTFFPLWTGAFLRVWRVPGPCRSVRRRGHPGSVRSQNSSFGSLYGVYALCGLRSAFGAPAAPCHLSSASLLSSWALNNGLISGRCFARAASPSMLRWCLQSPAAYCMASDPLYNVERTIPAHLD